MISSKELVNRVYDGRWKIFKIELSKTTTHRVIYLKNIYNDREINVDIRTLMKIERGETTISKVLRNKLAAQGKIKKGYKF